MEDKLAGVLIGTALGDALGLPYEGLKPQRIPADAATRHRFFFSKGMLSDDSEHSFMVGNAVLVSGDDPSAFQTSLAWKLRWWLLPLPAGVGMATAKAIIKLWCGVPARKAGVFSAGNGPAMRSALVGVYYADDNKRREMVAANTQLTHPDPKAEVAAQAIALVAARVQGGVDGAQLLEECKALAPESDVDWHNAMDLIDQGLEDAWSVSQFISALGCDRGITGYSYHTVPAVLCVFLSNMDNPLDGLSEIIRAGGDTDTTAAILGALYGAKHGEKAFPGSLVKNIAEWPRGLGHYRQLARALANKRKNLPTGPVRFFWPGIVVRNLFFLLVVLCHGFVRPFLFLTRK